MQSKAKTVAAYLSSLPEDRRAVVEAVRVVILKNLDQPGGLEERMQYGMIGYALSHRVYPAGYHCDPEQPVPFAGLAAQKNHFALYLFCVYTDAAERERFEAEWRATGKRLDMGASCVRFKKLEDVPLAVVGRAIKRATARRFLAAYESGLSQSRAGRERRPAPAKAAGPAATKPRRGTSGSRPRRAAPRGARPAR